MEWEGKERQECRTADPAPSCGAGSLDGSPGEPSLTPMSGPTLSHRKQDGQFPDEDSRAQRGRGSCSESHSPHLSAFVKNWLVGAPNPWVALNARPKC
ncbi:hypothetical protein H8959_009956 [Pygathrix nigripes]